MRIFFIGMASFGRTLGLRLEYGSEGRQDIELALKIAKGGVNRV
jgi:hypothetical protein